MYFVLKSLLLHLEYNLDDYDAKISLNAIDASITVVTKDFSFRCVADFKNNKPSLKYDSVKTKWNFKESGLNMELDAGDMDIAED